MFSRKQKFIFCFILGVILFIPISTQAVWSQAADFFVDSTFDLYGRDRIETQLLKTTNQIYFYADKNWYQNFTQKNDLDNKIYNLASNFEYSIYPKLTNLLETEDLPGIDNDNRIVILIHPLKDNYGGYIRSGDNYSKQKYQFSNEGQIIYLNSNLLLKADLNFLNYELAHEFAHLITLKQKPDAPTWFYELISEFAGQISSNDATITQKRAQGLLYSSEINFSDWQNSEKDYGKIYLFTLYLKEQFGENLFAEALKYPSADGITSFNEALKKYHTNFDDALLNWLITVLYNTCSDNNLKYCYQNLALNNYSIIPYIYYLPMQQKSSLSVTDSLKALSGKWQKVNGGLGTIELKFSIPEQTPITKIPYITQDSQGKKI